MIEWPELPEIEYYKATWEERHAFLSAAAESRDIRLAEELRTMVYARVLKAPGEYYAHPHSPASVSLREELNGAMRKWAEKFNLLDVEWVIPMAWNAINLWQAVNDGGLANPFAAVVFYTDLPKFNWPPWTGMNVSADEYRDRAEREFHTVLEKYIEENKIARAKEPQILKRRRKGALVDRYRWTALRICLRWSYRKIAALSSNPEGVSEQSVREMVELVCLRIGLHRLRSRKKRP